MNEPMEQLRPAQGGASPGYLEVIGLVLVIVLGALLLYDRYLVPRVKVVDLQGYLQEQKVLLTAGTISKEQWQRNLDTLEQMLKQPPRHHLILLKDVVLRHAPDAEL